MPEILQHLRLDPQQHKEKTREALESCVRDEQEEMKAVEEQGYDWEEDGPWWMGSYSRFHYTVKVGVIFIVDEEMLSTTPPAEGKVLVVWYDDMGRVVRSSRQSAYETWSTECLEETMGGAITEHGQWTLAEPGDEYDWDASLGPPYSLEKEEDEDGDE
jgi:hypothetical protein